MLKKIIRLYVKVAYGIKIGCNTKYYISKTSKINTNGKLLSIGETWVEVDSFSSLLVLRDHAKLTTNGDFRIYTGAKIYINKNAHLKLGSGYINHNLNLSCFSMIEIGENVAISENVSIRDSDNHEIVGSKQPMTAPISIGNKVWIGMNVTILKGVHVGDGAVIAANSLVNSDVPSNSLVGGVPARVIKNNIQWK